MLQLRCFSGEFNVIFVIAMIKIGTRIAGVAIVKIVAMAIIAVIRNGDFIDLVVTTVGQQRQLGQPA